ncbi:sigma-54 interaction domain-containing protein [Cytobacillus purgationiresistens]|uniref:Transcriptional regulator with PAS, ATPase and Fis domain n=1 Tax=Cytobacillus purgationiresistens TaxID=863449 RepID=A0ABU0AN58_9BACI|nr:sigma 54-interacting transcriptional regulator [Cytobacillus purgationiresistens]MDQ0272687.1 transcriptional regulator with PAS, ATPase and Fis domain [Cytobacillus purgationiresistens]
MREDRSNQLQLLNAMIESLPFGVMVMNNEKEVLMSNQRLHCLLEGEMDEFYEMIQQSSVSGTNIHLRVHEKQMIVRYEKLFGYEGADYMYLCSSPALNEAELIKDNDGDNEILIQDILEYAYDGLVIVDSEGYVRILTKAYADFLRVDQKSSIGKHVTEVIENTRMHIVVKTGKQETAALQKVNDGYMIATRSPIIKGGKVVGAVGKLLFKNVGQFSALFKRLNILEKELKKYKGDFRESNKSSYTFDQLIGKSQAFAEVKARAQKVAENDSNVLLLGESGTGKELFAHAIHHASRRSMGVFVKVNCAAIPSELIESELFGYEEGSFTGAKKGGKAGKFEAADGGTIFLDEIGELPIHMQVKLLRVLQEKEVERVGSSSSIAVDVRIVAATNRNLEEMVEKGEFRLDLYYRLKVMEILVPSLKDRQQDIEFLVDHFIKKYQHIMMKRIKGMDERAMRLLLKYNWPGNIRELENIIERAMNIVDPNQLITKDQLPNNIRGHVKTVSVRSLAEVMEETERQTILASLETENGNKTEAAKQLGISRTTLYEKMNKYGLGS